MVRARIRLDTTRAVKEFCEAMNSDGTITRYTVEDYDGVYRVNARSYLGMIAASVDFGEHMYLVNETEDGVFPSFVDKFRHPGDDGEFIHQ